MKCSKITKSIAVAIGLGAFALQGMTLSVDKVQQRYPWNGLVDIDYTITAEAGDRPTDVTSDRLEMTVINKAVTPNAVCSAYATSPAPLPISAGKHRVTWNANADGVDFVSGDVAVTVAVKHYAPKYMVVDLTHMNAEGKYDVEYLSGEPANGFNQNVYKSDKIVFRMIPPGSYVAGSPTTEPGRSAGAEVQHNVTISKPFYMGIYEVTQAQYKNVVTIETVSGIAADPSTMKGEYRPVDTISYSSIRGSADTTSHRYEWPYEASVSTNNTFIGLMCKRTGLGIDLPTAAQWEYACRAGTTTPFGNGIACATAAEMSAALLEFGRFSDNKGTGDYADGTTTVGSYEPNGWGLYDMHGNVPEWCLDYYFEGVQNLGQQVDPVGSAENSGLRTLRGGGHSASAQGCRCAGRAWDGPSFKYKEQGFRLTCRID